MSFTNEINHFSAFAKGKISRRTYGTNAVIYTRVSTKEQADTNLSLETQRKACSQYADKQGYTVQAYFGGTYESAQTDERKEFSAMLSYVKKARERISYIIVYSLERFSRNSNSIWLSNNLRALDIEILSVTQPIDLSNPSGKMQQKMLFLFGEFDNELRKQKCMAGTKEMLLRGDWPCAPAFGYDIVRINNNRRIVVNQKGKILRQAFTWKIDEGLSNEAIRLRLREKGIQLYLQRISEIFKNPFYCGLLVHNLLEGQVVEGNHEKLVSKEVFLKANGVVNHYAHGYINTEENDAIPLKRFVHCDECGKPMRGYIVKKKNIHYYKCNTIGCGNNTNAAKLNTSFAEILEAFALDEKDDAVHLIKTQMTATFNQLTVDCREEAELVQQRLIDINKKIFRLEERFIEEDVSAELYDKYSGRYIAERKEIENQLSRATQVSNLQNCIETVIKIAIGMPATWLSADYSTKQQLQFLVFPQGIRYSKKINGCRTTRINSVFARIAYLKQNLAQKKRGIPALQLNYASLSSSVPSAGVEPARFPTGV